MIDAEERRAMLWLSLAQVSADRFWKLMRLRGSAKAIREAYATGGDPFSDAERASLSALHSDEQLETELEQLSRKHVRLLCYGGEDYPSALRDLEEPPYLLYAVGDLAALSSPGVAVVGTRKASAYGREVARSMSAELCRAGICVVSGMARGIDASAHMGALDADGRTIGVLGSGLDAPYPPENTELCRAVVRRGGLLLTEYPMGAAPLSYHFPWRNRIIAALSLGVVFVEGRIRSGGMLTVDLALKLGREVFAVPGRIGTDGSEGPHAIIREGATLVTSADEVLQELRYLPPEWQEPPEAEAEQTPLERRILDELRREPMTPDELGEAIGEGGDRLLAALGMLEIGGAIRREGGNRYAPSIGRRE